MIEAFIALLFGLLIGSFLNVCIHRWPRNRSVVKPRSHCVRCRKPIAWYDNIPVVSYVILGGRCRNCGKNISFRYPAVELITGLIFFYIVWTLGPTPLAAKNCVFAAMLLALVFSDLEKRILPDQFTLGGVLVGFAFSFFVKVPDITAGAIVWLFGGQIGGKWDSPVESLMGALAPALFLWGGAWLYERVRHQEGLGLGDVKLIAMVGAFTGIRGALTTLVLGSVTGTLLGYAFIKATGKDTATYQLPFGSFLGACALLTALAGPRMLGM